jgi:hypothetical protein
MEHQMETMRRNLSALKDAAGPKEKKKKKAPRPAPPPVASSSKPKAPKPAPPHASASVAKSSKKGKAKVTDDEALTFDQKKALSDAIGALDGGKLEKVIQIIHEGVPEIRDVSFLEALLVQGGTNILYRAPRRSSWRSTLYLLLS